jgi:DHA1 family bicyclomycin/chloramphenicol resistance-like MFS transporter
MKVKQKYLGNGGTLLFLAVISAFPPLTTDLYLPALPNLVAFFATTPAKVNMTLSLFFIFYATGLLFWGPLSEKYGRKKILLIGHALYISASVLCALSQSIDQLIIARILQAFSGSAVTVVAMSAVKDLYEGRQREKMMATVMSMVAVAPMVAPVLGAFMLKFASWQVLFAILVIFGCLSMTASCFFQESLTEFYKGSLLRSWARLFHVLKNGRFTLLLFIFSIIAIAFMAFIGSASFIYISHFGLSEQSFSFFYAFNVLFATTGPMLYMRLSKKMPAQKIIAFGYLLIMLCGLAVIFFGELSPWLFAALIGPATLANMVMRVPSTNLMLEQQERDTGSAAALIQFSAMFLGSAGMTLVSFNPEHMIETLGGIQVAIGFIGGAMWWIIRNRSFVVDKLSANRR